MTSAVPLVTLPPWCSVRQLPAYLRDDREIVCVRCDGRLCYDGSKTRDEAALLLLFVAQHRHEDGP